MEQKVRSGRIFLGITIFLLGLSPRTHATDLSVIHQKAVELFQNTHSAMNDPARFHLVREGLSKYFKISIANEEQKPLRFQVQTLIRELSSKVGKSKYRSHRNKKGLWCAGSPLAIVPPPKWRVHLCPSFFKNLNEEKQIGTVLHEWFHLWGKKRINYLPEKYCYQSAKLEAKELIRNADQYMLFVAYVGSGGQELACF